MSFHHILSDLVSDFGKGPKRFFILFLDLFSELAKSSQPTLESSSIQTTEPIVKCHTILEMGSHDLSPHTFGSGLRFFKGLQKGVKKNWTYFQSRESLIGCNTNLCRPLKTFVCVSLRYRKHYGGSVEIVVEVCGKICGNICGNMCGKMCIIIMNCHKALCWIFPLNEFGFLCYVWNNIVTKRNLICSF